MENVMELIPEPSPVFTTKPVRRRKPKRSWKRICILVASCTFISLIILGYASYRINGFFETHELEFHSPIQMPVRVVPRRHPDNKIEALLLPEAHAQEPEKQVDAVVVAEPVPTLDVGNIVTTIYRLESSSGVNDPCVRDKKGYNGYGYIPGTCYKSHMEVTRLVTQWVEQHKDLSIAEMLCGYNLGFKSKHMKACMNQDPKYPYYRDYLNLN